MARTDPTDPDVLRAVIDRYRSQGRAPIEAAFDALAAALTYPSTQGEDQ